jgi:hypothetical protein
MESRLQLFGLPLLHVTGGRLENGRYRRGIARGWVAVGDVAFGVILAVGGVAVGGIGVGGVGIGFLALGGAAIGGFALGGLAIGVVAAGGAAFAWWAAFGGLAVARDVAVGGAASALHANDPAAHDVVAQHPFLWLSSKLLQHSRWLVLLAVLPALLVLLRRLRGMGEDTDAPRDRRP